MHDETINNSFTYMVVNNVLILYEQPTSIIIITHIIIGFINDICFHRKGIDKTNIQHT